MRRRAAAALALAALLVPSGLRAAAEDPPAPAPAPAPAETVSAAGTAVPGTAAPRTPAPPRVLRLGVRDAVATALKNNLDLKVVAHDPGIAAASLREAETLYDVLFTSRLGGGERQEPVPAPFLGDGTEISEDFVFANAGVRRLLPSGATIGLDAGVDKTLTNSPGYAINPYYSSRVTLSLRQPLLKFAGREVTESGVRLARDARDEADLDLRARTEDLVRQVESGYWLLVSARGDVTAQAKSVAVAEDFLRVAEARLAAGSGTRVDVSQAAAGVAARRVDLLRAENNQRSVEENLLGLLFPRTPDAPTGDAITVETADDPDASLPPLPTESPEDAVVGALTARTDIRTQRIAVDRAEVAVLVAESDLKPRMDVEATFGYAGVDGHADTTFSHSMAQREWPNWSVGLFFEVPLGNRPARARYERAVLLRSRAEAVVRSLESAASVRVRNARRDLESARETIDAARRSTLLAEEQLDAERERLKNDKSTTFEVLRLESDLTGARRTELRSVLEYLTASIRYEYEKGRLLESRSLLK